MPSVLYFTLKNPTIKVRSGRFCIGYLRINVLPARAFPELRDRRRRIVQLSVFPLKYAVMLKLFSSVVFAELFGGGKKSDFTRHLLYGCVCAPAIPENLLESRRRGYGRDVAAVGLPENRNRPDVRAEGPAGRKRNARPTIVVPPSRQQ